jgi:hypothetical protein
MGTGAWTHWVAGYVDTEGRELMIMVASMDCMVLLSKFPLEFCASQPNVVRSSVAEDLNLIQPVLQNLHFLKYT